MPQTISIRDGSAPVPVLHARDWEGPNDPENPRNFTLKRRTFSTISIIFLAFVSTFGASVYSAGIKGVIEEYGVSEELAILPLSLYTLGLALGPLIGAPLCETVNIFLVFSSSIQCTH